MLSLFQCHCLQGYWMGYTASCVLWFGFIVNHAEGCIHSEQGCKLFPLPLQSRKTDSKAGKSLCGLDSSLPAPHVPWLNSATGCFADDQFCLPDSLLECCWAKQLPGVLARLSGQAGPGAALHSVQSYCSPV